MKHKISIQLDPLGFGKVILDGHDISDVVTATTMNSDVGAPTEVTLVLKDLDVDILADLNDVNLVERRLLDDEAHRNPEGY